ncbi:transposase IS30 [Bifidobacterium pseudolongum subsp. globosum]|uniref:IS30 family transposase n=1 Tax=Bifidobacterium pseudolongum TaxID=1694 RepID=UPI0010D24D06|nr:transposase IS30 [Bifidobacterium pseudolongum subsp. globosum]RYQ09442.1 transposase IS30 [Bifidobacterium pseudolongum subsp. globosum]RYQ14370.1 transposase IS30 [Bifidobacterium pseudolongum subsp. globosum]RYQ15847.1 transposase IS30 [Bifidobacterium pseudolongum subsp. globosum]
MAYEFEGVRYGKLRDMQEARRARYVQLLEEGLNFTQAAHAAGVSKRTGKVWRNGRTRSNGRNERPLVDWYGGRVKDSTTIVSSRYLSIDERIEIADLSRSGTSVRGIARRLGRGASTVSRELRRNAHPADGGYRPHRADQLAASRRPRPKRRKIRPGTDLYAYVAAGLKRHWSPEQISNRLVREYPDNDHMRACHETIYQAVYVQPRGELRRQVSNALRKGRAVRRSRSDGQSRRPRFREPMVMISERPAQIEDRAVPGHWEGDLICGTSNKSAIGTLVERTTRYTVLLALPDGHDAEHVQRAITAKMGQLPAPLLNSLTWDQGAELALHRDITASLDMQVYFCDPHSPWQRGTNENTNGLLRQYFPKGTDLSAYSQDYLDAVADELNDRPRKTLDWAKPSERIIELLNAMEYAQ